MNHGGIDYKWTGLVRVVCECAIGIFNLVSMIHNYAVWEIKGLGSSGLGGVLLFHSVKQPLATILAC